MPAFIENMVENARLAEELGFNSLWFAEHRFWYDGWNPSPLIAAAAAAAATRHIRLGTAMLILPQHDPVRVTNSVHALAAAAGPRIDLGVSLGYRDEEYDGLGLPRAQRGSRMNAALNQIVADPGIRNAARLWIGGMAGPALQRGIEHGAGFMLPPTLTPGEVMRVVGTIKQAASEQGRAPGRVAIIKDTWVDEDADAAREFFLPGLANGFREYGAWWTFKGSSGYERPDLVEKQVKRGVATALVGSPSDLVRGMTELFDAGVDDIVLHLARDTTIGRLPAALLLVAREVLPNM